MLNGAFNHLLLLNVNSALFYTLYIHMFYVFMYPSSACSKTLTQYCGVCYLTIPLLSQRATNNYAVLCSNCHERVTFKC